MTSSETTGGGPSLRTAGVALLGLAAIAGLVGVITLTGGTGGDDEPVAQAPPSVSGEPDGSAGNPGTTPGSTPSLVPPPRVTAAPPAIRRPAPAAPLAPGPGRAPALADVPAGSGGGAADVGGAAGAAQTAGTVRVYNNSTIRGLAARAAADMRSRGWTIEEVGNYSAGIVPTTTVYYENESQRRAAETAAEQFGMRVEPRFAGIRDAAPGLIVIVTNDYSV